jgi:hypothetical protein
LATAGLIGASLTALAFTSRTGSLIAIAGIVLGNVTLILAFLRGGGWQVVAGIKGWRSRTQCWLGGCW